MKYIFLMGGSGTGKTTIAKRLEELQPEKFSRTRELASREIREGEIDGYDYIFITPEQFELEKDNLFEKVEYQFKDKYGCRYENLYDNKWNVVIVCIEAFMSALKNVKSDDSAILINLVAANPFVKRDGRDPKQEENMNKAVLYNIVKDGTIRLNQATIRYFEIDPVDLTRDTLLLERIENMIETVPLIGKIKNTSDLDDLKNIFKKYSLDIANSDSLISVLSSKCNEFSLTLQDLGDIILNEYRGD